MLMPEIPAVEDRYLFGTGPFVFLARDFDSNFVTHDERRYRFTESGSPPTRASAWAARPSAGPARPCAR